MVPATHHLAPPSFDQAIQNQPGTAHYHRATDTAGLQRVQVDPESQLWKPNVRKIFHLVSILAKVRAPSSTSDPHLSRSAGPHYSTPHRIDRYGTTSVRPIRP